MSFYYEVCFTYSKYVIYHCPQQVLCLTVIIKYRNLVLCQLFFAITAPSKFSISIIPYRNLVCQLILAITAPISKFSASILERRCRNLVMCQLILAITTPSKYSDSIIERGYRNLVVCQLIRASSHRLLLPAVLNSPVPVRWTTKRVAITSLFTARSRKAAMDIGRFTGE